MPNKFQQGRTDTASRVIAAEPSKIYRALLDPNAIAAWRPPKGMKASIYEFEPREGGTFRMAFAYVNRRHGVRGKTTEHADIFRGRFLELVPDRRIVEIVDFESDDPSFTGPMTVTTTLRPVRYGTNVTIVCQNVPFGIRPGEHQAGIRSSLKNLAAYTE